MGHFAVAPPPASFTSQSVLQAAAANHTGLLTGAWLDGVGSALLIVTFLGVAELAGLAGTLAGRILRLGGAAIVAHSLLSDSLLVAAAQIDTAGNAALAAGLFQVLHAAD